MTEALTTTQPKTLAPTTLAEAMQFAELVAQSSFAPNQYRGKPGDVVVALQMGMEVGLAPMQALQNIAVINGRPSLWGDAALAIVVAHPSCVGVDETYDDATETATCTVQRGKRNPVIRTFSVDDAKRAKLWGKQGPWTQYPKRMLQMRARGFAIRDAFPDALRGLITREEAMDIPGPITEVSRSPVKARIREIAPPAGKPIGELASEPVPETESEPDYEDAERQRIVAEYTARIDEAHDRDEVVALFREARRMAPFEGRDAQFEPIVTAARVRTEYLQSSNGASNINREPGAEG